MKASPIQVTLVDHCGSDLSVVNAARVSFHKESEWETKEDPCNGFTWEQLSAKDDKLINYLAKHQHLSPFNHCFLSFRVKAPVFVARQLVKHKFMPWNEVSRRYVDEEPEFYFPEKWRARATDKKQGSSNEEVDKIYCDDALMQVSLDCMNRYNKLLAKGVAPEQARIVLPHTLMTEWIWSGTLGAFAAMLKLRLKPDTQEETRAVALLISKEVERLFPVSYKALLNETSI